MQRSPSLSRIVLVLCVTVVALAALAAQMAVLSELPTLSASLPGRGLLARLSSAVQMADLDAIWEQMSARLPSALPAPSAEDEVRAAWQRAQEAGAYQFTADIRQTTVPKPTIFNVGRQSKQETLHLEGETNLPTRQLHLTLWSQGGSVLDASSGVEIKVDGDRAYARQGVRDWQEVPNFTGLFAPQGDFMAFLSAAKNVRVAENGIRNTQYVFRIDGPSYAAYVRDQLERYLTEKGELPPGVSLELPKTYKKMTGQGELWIGADGLPLRQIMHLQFPPVKDEQEVRAEVTVDFSDFRKTAGSVTRDWGLGARDWVLSILDLPLTPGHLSLVPLTFVFCTLLATRCRSKKLYIALALTVIFSLIFSPLLQSLRVQAFFEQQQVRAQEQEALQQESKMQRDLEAFLTQPNRNPNQNPLGTPRNTQHPMSTIQLPTLASNSNDNNDDSTVPECDSDDSGDADGDGLTDFEECVLGLNPDLDDSDGDALKDNEEVNGFSYNDKMWYTDPLEMDTNKDGLSDVTEWNTGREEGGIPPDTDGDGTPDLFDRDNDGDGVPDNLDVSPYYKGDTIYTTDAPFQLVVDHLSEDAPVFVEFQLRPTDPDHLWYAFNVLDWPRGDNLGQMQDSDGKTFYDVDNSGSRSPDDNGDVKLVPMLEIRITGSPTNLPPQEDLDPYGIFVQDLTDDGEDKAVYVPLRLIEDDVGDARVAFSGRMFYQAADSWGNAQQVRLVWVVQGLVDECQEYKDGRCTRYGDKNQVQLLHTYDDDWTLTGLSVHEERGTDIAIIYEDPDVDDDLDSDDALTFLTYGLGRTFMAGSDCENIDTKGTQDPSDDECIGGDGERDITLNEIYRRWNHETNVGAGVSVTDTWHITETAGNVLSVVTDTFTTLDQALMHVTITDTRQILDDHFTPHWTASNPISPTLLFAREERFRGFNLDEQMGDNAALITWSDSRQLKLDLKPEDVQVQTMAGMKWAPYRYQDGEWVSYPIIDYWDELQRRYEDAFSDDYNDEPNPEEVRGGAVVAAQIHYVSLYLGSNTIVQVGGSVQRHQSWAPDSTLAKQTAGALRHGINFILKMLVNTGTLKALWGVVSGKGLEGFKNIRYHTHKWLGKTVAKFEFGLSLLVTAATITAILFNAGYLTKASPSSAGEIQMAVSILVGTVLFIGKVLVPVMSAVFQIQSLVSYETTALKATGRVLTTVEKLSTAAKTLWVIGLLLAVGVTWGFFIYYAVKDGLDPTSVAFDVALAQTIAATIVTIVLFMLSLTVIGAIIVGIVVFVDTLLGLLGVEFSILGTVTSAVAKTFFAFELAVDVEDDDLIKMGVLDSKLVHPEQGMVPGAQFEFKTTITSTVTHQPPRQYWPSLFLWKYDEDQIRSSSFEFELDPESKSITTRLWDTNRVHSWHVSEAFETWGHTFYTGWFDDDLSTVSTVSEAGINRTVPLILSTGYALPGIECWAVLWVISWWIPVVVCVDKGLEGGADPADLGSSIVVDVFPHTLDEFVQVGEWAPEIKFKDTDGDGLMAQTYGGNDPDDGKWDTDGDGLSDAWELRRASFRFDEGGYLFDPRDDDTDGDGLSDQEEAILATDPKRPDSDGDGISDAAETEGWDFYYAYPKKTRIFSDPLNADADGDGMDDLFERTLHTECGKLDDESERRDCYNNNLFHPYRWNTNPIGVYTEVGDPDKIVKPTQTFLFTTTVRNNVETGSPLWVRGTTQLDPAPLTGHPLEMTFDIAKDKSQSLYSDLTVPAGTGNQTVTLTTDVNAQLHTPSVWAWDPWQTGSHATSYPKALSLATVPVTGWNTAYAAVSQESYRVRGYRVSPAGITGGGVDVFNDANWSATAAPDIACNDSGRCLVVHSYKKTSNDTYGVTWRRTEPNWSSMSGIWIEGQDGCEAWGATVASDGDGFLVAWLRKCSGSKEIKVRRVLANGYATGGVMTLDSASDVGFPKLAWVGDRYQAVWERDDDIYTAHISGDSVTGPEAVSASAASEWSPRLAYDPLSGRTLVIYTSRSGGNRSLRGRILAGPNTSDEFTIGNLTDQAGWEAAVSNDPVNGGWAVTWSLNGQYTVYSQGVGMNGELRGERERAEPGGRNYLLDVTCAEPRIAALYHLDEEGDTACTFADSSGFDHDASCWQDYIPSGKEGKRGKAVYFEGHHETGNPTFDEGAWIRAADVGLSVSSYGITFWFKAECDTCGIYSVGDAAAFWYHDHDRDIYLLNGNLCAKLGEGDPNDAASEIICTSGTNFNDGQWHHVAHTFGGIVGGQRLYVDGKLRAEGELSSSNLHTQSVIMGVAVGVQPCNVYSCDDKRFFKGYFDELTVYPRALSEGEVVDDYLGALVVYPFDEVSGAETFNNAARSSNYGAAECSAGECPRAGKEGVAHNAVKFDGTDDLITGPDLPLAESSFTIAFWAKRQGIDRNEYFVSQGSGGSDRDLYIGFWSNNHFICAFHSDNYLVTPNQYTDTDWHHWACTYDFDTGQRTIYRDGEQVAQDTTAPGRYYWGSDPLRIGKARWGNYFRGLLDELAVWPGVLSASEIETLYKKVKALDDSVTECLVSRTTHDGDDLHVNRTALRETTTPLGRSEQQVEDEVTVDGTLPIADITSLADGQHIGETGTLPIGGEARDNTYVTKVEVNVDGGAWQEAEGVETWTWDWDTSSVGEGWHTLSVQANDPADNVSDPPSSINVLIDRTGPQLTVTDVRGKAWKDSQERWWVWVKGTVADMTDGSLSVLMQTQEAGGGWQSRRYSAADGSPSEWTLNYTLPTFDNEGNALPNPTGAYTLYMRAEDDAGNDSPEAAYGVFEVDNTPPVADLRDMGPYTDAIACDDVTLTGVITDPGPIDSGVGILYVKFEPVAELYKPWWYYHSGRATLAESGWGITTTTWTYDMPELDGFYELRLEGHDVQPWPYHGSRTTPWNGMVDTVAPRLEPSLRYVSLPFGPTEVTCYVEDLNLDDNTFIGCPCPEDTWQRTYFHEISSWYSEVTTDTNRLVRITANCQVNGPLPSLFHHACDLYGHCRSATYPIDVPIPPTPTPWPTPEWGPTPTPTTEPTATPTPTPTPTPPPPLPLDSAVITPSHGTVFSTTAAFDVEGQAFAEDYLQTLTVTVNSTPFWDTDWPEPPDPAAVTETTWITSYTPLAEGYYTLNSWASNWTSQVQTTTHPITVTVDLQPPSPPTFDTNIITTARRAAQGTAILSGGAADNFGVAGVDINPDDRGWGDATLTGDATSPTWRYTWPITNTSDPDGVTYNVTARATDFASHTNTSAPTALLFDMQAPQPVTITLAYFDVWNVRHPVEARQVITDGNRLIIEWTQSTDGSGVAGYWVGWTDSPTSTAGTTYVPEGPVYSYTQVISEAREVYAHVIPVDIHGNRREQMEGPVYVDTPLTPDLLRTQRPPGLLYHGWMESGCTQMGRSRSVADRAPTSASLSEHQDFYTTWDADALRLAWVGANWDVEGDLFIYLDTKPGGAMQLLNPYGGLAPGIYLPGNLPELVTSEWPEFEKVRQSQTVTMLQSMAMQADYLVWVQDSETAALSAWDDDDGWAEPLWLSPDQYQWTNGVTDLYLPFDLLGISDPATSSLGLLAAASEEDALRLWSAMPDRNLLNSALAVNPLAAVQAAIERDFVLPNFYRWPSLGPLLCPYSEAVLGLPTSQDFQDSDLRVELAVEPLGTTYALFGDDLFWQWETLFQESGPKSQQFTFLDNTHPPVGQDDVITYSLRVSNRGTSEALDVQAVVLAYSALMLPDGTRFDPGFMEYQQLNVGSIAPGETVTTTFSGVVEVESNWRYDRCVSVDGLPPEVCRQLLQWAILDGLVFDARNPFSGTTGIPTEPPLEWVWADHAVDIDPPQSVGIEAPKLVVGPGDNTVRGYASDPSGVPLVEVEVRDGLGVTTTLNCPDVTPHDGQWTCEWNVVGNDGDEFELRARATDGYGHVSDWTIPWHVVVVDATPPTMALDDEARAAVDGQLIGPDGELLSGPISDTHSSVAVQVCRDVDGETVCESTTTLASTQAPTDTAHPYDDVPTEGIVITGLVTDVITATTYCGGGEITRTFTVSDAFIIGDVDLGFNATHPAREEMVAELVSPAGTRALVIAPSGATYGFANYDVWLDDAASGPLHAPLQDDGAEPYFDRPAQPFSPLSAFIGEASQGVWQLNVCDLNPTLNEGTYNRSRLSLTPQSTALSTAGRWNYSLPWIEGADGLSVTLDIYGLDGVGNRTPEPISLTYQLDVVPPGLTTTVVITILYGLSPTLVLAGQVSDGGGVDEVYVRVDPPEATSHRDLATRGGGDWAYVLRPNSGGTYTLWLEAHDLAGNVTQAGPFEVEIACTAADLTTAIVSAQTPVGATSPISLTARLTNNGPNEAATGLPVAFYLDGDLIGTASTTQALEEGEWEDLTITWDVDLSGDYDITIVVNDDGTGARPLVLCSQPPDVQQPVTLLDVPLVESWNLMSTYVNPFNTDTSVVQRPISGTYVVIQGFDGEAQSYYPDLPPEVNTLKDMDGEHGYWIKTVTGDQGSGTGDQGSVATLRVVGEKLAEDRAIELDAGWNLVSYLPRQPLAVADALQSIAGLYSAVLGFDQGALSYYPDIDPSFNTLHEMTPLFGYWIRMTQAGTLQYPTMADFRFSIADLRLKDGIENHKSQIANPTNAWFNFYGPAPLPVGTVVQAIDPDGVVCGATVIATEGQYGLLACYGDDPATPEDEGARLGDTIQLVVEGQVLGVATCTEHGSRQWAPLGKAEAWQVYLPMIRKGE